VVSGRDRREVLADDVRRLAGLAEAAIGEAASLDLEVPEDVARCVACWRHWAWRLGDREEER
jgi:hypothetical protein